MPAKPQMLAKLAPSTPPARILIVDDSAVARAVIAKMIEANPRFAVAGAVADAHAARDFLREHQVEVILLDIEMPGIDGLTALSDLIEGGRGARVIIVSSSCAEGAAATIQALTLGAADTLVKPGLGNLVGRFGDALIEKITRLVDGDDTGFRRDPHLPVAPGAGDFDIIAIGASTGGIHALSQMLRAIPASFQTPMLITQHLPASFMPYFAAQIAVLAGRPCEVAHEHMRIKPGRVVIAPGDSHLRCARYGDAVVAKLTQERVTSGCLPSVDPMLATVADTFGPRALGVVLSGMGRDGALGAAHLSAAGGSLVVQDKASSVVWGMPGAVANGGFAHAVLPPEDIGRLIAAGKRPQ